MKLISTLILAFGFSLFSFNQDTFSIVAIDSATGEVGAAGASCVDLDAFGIANDDFIAQLFPVETGAITCQAAYNSTNQANAKFRMFEGYTPDGIRTWLYDNDVSGNPESRQYGIVAMVSGSPETASFTGSLNTDYKNHIEGPNYAIQGNILLGQEILDSMEARFNAEVGDLTCKLMAALQGANVIGADTRCMTNGTSSLFAFLKVSQPTATFGSPSYLISVRTNDGDGIEPIDSLQVLFDASYTCSAAQIEEISSLSHALKVYPNPTENFLWIKYSNPVTVKMIVRDMSGKELHTEEFLKQTRLDVSNWTKGIYTIHFSDENEIVTERFLVY
jgi:uncharacterized Ntn-hydrolase superfamily protein